LNYDCDDFDFQFGDILGVDVIPAVGNPTVPGCQTPITDGEIALEYEICVEVTLIDEDISIPLDLGDDLFVCEGESINIDAGSDYEEYDWAPIGDMTQDIDVGVGIYELMVTDDNGCTDTDIIQVFEYMPEVSIDADDDDNIICEGTTIELEAVTSETTIEWSTGQTSSTIEVGPGVYMVTVTDANDCQDVDIIEIIESIPTVTIDSDDGDNIICEGQTVELEANTTETNIEWSTGETDEIIEVGPGDYSVTVTDGNGCMAEAMISVTENPEPTVDISVPTNEVCGNGTVLAEATPGYMTYVWSNGSDDETVNLGVGVYQLTITDVNGCTAETSIEIFGVDPPDAGEDAVLEVCNDGSTYDLENLINAGDTGGTWDDPDGSGLDLNNNADDVDFTDVDAGMYELIYSVPGIVPCDDAVATIMVTVYNQFNAGDDNDMLSCGDEFIDLESLLGDFDPGGDWTDLDNADVNLSDPSNVDFSDVDPGTYEFEYTIEGEGPCVDAVATITIEVEPNAEAGDNNDISICTGTIIDLNTALSNDAQAGGNFEDTDGSNSLTGSFFDSDGLQGQTFDFTYQVGDVNSLCGNDEAVITVSVVDQVSAGNDSDNNLLCLGESVNLFDYLTNADLGGVFQNNMGDDISSMFDADAEGSFLINYIIGDDVVCPSDEAEIELIVVPEPTISAQLSVNSFCDSSCHELIIELTGQPDFIFTLDFIDLENSVSYSINDMSSISQHILTVCDYNVIPNISNDTIFFGQTGGSWAIALESIIDGNCSVELVPEQGDTIFLNSYENYFSSIQETLCPGDSLDIGGVIYNESNPFAIDTLNTINGCDSIIEISLDFFDPAIGLVDDELCAGSSIIVNGTVYDENMPMGQEILEGTSLNGCDSIVNIDLSFVSGFDIIIDTTFCPGDSLFIDGTWQFDEATIIEDLQSTAGCDSMVTYNLFFFEESNFTLEDVLCSGESIMVNGIVYDELNDSGVEVLEDMGVNGCDSIVIVDLSFNPVYDLASDTTLCQGDSIFINGLWVYENEDVIEILQTVAGCDSIITTSIVFESCDLEFILDVQSVNCFEDVDGKIIVNNVNAIAPITISWNGQNGGITGSIAIDDPTVNYCIEGLSADAYDITVLNDNGFSFEETMFVDGPTQVLSLSLNLMSDVSCAGESDGVIETMINGGTGPYELIWEGNTIADAIISDLGEGTYTAQAIDANGCLTEEMTIDLSEPEAISFQFDFGDPSCAGVSDGFITITDITGGVGQVDLSIDNQNLNLGEVLENLASGMYEVQVTDENGCMFTESIELMTMQNPDLVDYPSFYQLNFGDSILIEGNAFESDLLYDWQSSNAISCIDCANPMLIGAVSETVLLLVTSASGCQELVDIAIQVNEPDDTLVLPNTFSPNNDGVNDVFEIVFPFGFENAAVNFQIFDRWGNLMYNENNLANNFTGWDGRYNSGLVSSGVYTFTLQIESVSGNLIRKSGSITVIN